MEMNLELLAPERTVWAMESGALRSLVARLSRVREWPAREQVDQYRRQRADAAKRRLAGQGEMGSSDLVDFTHGGKTGIININGPIEQHLSFMSFLFGGASTELIGFVLGEMMHLRGVERVVLRIDSPGGTSYGVGELAQVIHEARGKKPITAIGDSLMASAAYWLGSQASSVSITPGGDVGSIGVYILHADMSLALAKEGVDVTMVRAGQHKAETLPFFPLADDARDHLQEMVDTTYVQFVRAVARGRGKPSEAVSSSFGQGRILAAHDARAVGMVDKVESFGQLLGRLGSSPSTSGARQATTTVASKKAGNASMEVLRARHTLAKARASEALR